MKTRKTIVTISFLVFTLIAGSSYAEMKHRVSHSGIIVPHLYAYSHKYILDLLTKYDGTKDHYFDLRRDSNGSSLYFHYRYDKKNKILKVTARDDPKILSSPSHYSSLNDQEEFVAWTDDIKKGIHFKNGNILHVPLHSILEIDPSGQYFFIVDAVRSTKIASIYKPDEAIARVNFLGESIFYKNGKIYLFTRNYQNIRGPGDYEQHEIICHIFSKNDSDDKFKLEEEIHIPRVKPRPSPYAVVDFDPWSDNVLLIDERDMPFFFLTSWYLFDLKTKKLTKIGRARDYGFFLQDDILENLRTK